MKSFTQQTVLPVDALGLISLGVHAISSLCLYPKFYFLIELWDLHIGKSLLPKFRCLNYLYGSKSHYSFIIDKKIPMWQKLLIVLIEVMKCNRIIFLTLQILQNTLKEYQRFIVSSNKIKVWISREQRKQPAVEKKKW